MPINSFLYPAKHVPVAHEVANSCRFDDGSSDSMTRDNGTPTNQKKCSISLWFKRTEPGLNKYLIVGFDDESNRTLLQFSSDQLLFQNQTGGSNNTIIKSNAVFRDPSAWYHFCVIVDTTQGTDTNRVKMYVNGSQVTSLASSTYPSQDTVMELTDAANSILINQKGDNSDYNSGYYSEVVVLDGTAASIGDFGEFDEDSPTIWKPKDVSGLTFGTNGFYLDFKDSSALGNDANGGTDFTVSNLTAIDQTTDTCTNNFCTVNSLDNYHQQSTFSEGNTKITFKGPTSVYAYNTGTFGVANGKWYWETKATSAGNHNVYGISGRYVIAYNKGLGVNTDEYGYYNYNGNYTNASSDGSYAENSFPGGNVTWTTGDIIGIALDLDSSTNTVKFLKNNVLIGTVDIIAPSSGFYYPAWNQFDNQAEVAQPNFGNPSFSISSGNADANGYGNFEYSPTISGVDYYALCTKNLAEYG